MNLGIDDDELSQCVSCGLCLPHCPTFRVTGDEGASPRGRIAAMRAVQREGAPADDRFVEVIDTCVQCRGCETACPSAVPFGRLMAATRESLASQPGYQPWWRRLGYRALGHHRLVLAGSTALAAGQRLHAVPRRLGLPRLPLRRSPLVPTGDDVWLFTGCVMDAWQRDVHAAVVQVLSATGAGVGLLGPGADCCGALAEHAGLGDLARAQARRVLAAAPPSGPIVVDSAGCGAMLQEYGRLLGTREAHEFAARVTDVHEWLAPRLERLPAPGVERTPRVVAVQDPCHLRHAQRAERHVRTVLAPFVDVVELDDDGLCCGAGGAFSASHPDLAGDIRARKLAAVARSGAESVASANPGCSLHLAAAGLDVRHPLEFVAEALGLGGPAH